DPWIVYLLINKIKLLKQHLKLSDHSCLYRDLRLKTFFHRQLCANDLIKFLKRVWPGRCLRSFSLKFIAEKTIERNQLCVITIVDDHVNTQAHHGMDLTTLIDRSEEHTSELQSREKLVCRLLLEKK